ncbi:MAG: N-acetyltransferase [Rubrobacter sp.]|nr:N-acetyltransferase [Rubrobacter sp.]
MHAEVRNTPTEHRYEVWVDGELADHAQYTLRKSCIAFIPTEVDEAYEGLAQGALDDARAQGLVIMPFCPFIVDFIERHLDQYRDLVAPEMLSPVGI